MNNNFAINIEGEIHSSKNSRQIMINQRTHKPFVAKSKLSKSDEGSFALQLNSQRDKWIKMMSGRSYPVTIIFSFRRSTHRPFDYVNMAQGILDAMVKAEYLPDDSMKYVIPAFVPYCVSDNPGCDVTVDE